MVEFPLIEDMSEDSESSVPYLPAIRLVPSENPYLRKKLKLAKRICDWVNRRKDLYQASATQQQVLGEGAERLSGEMRLPEKKT